MGNILCEQTYMTEDITFQQLPLVAVITNLVLLAKTSLKWISFNRSKIWTDCF